MPYQGPGLRQEATATKVVNHGDPVVENNFSGSAFKTAQLGTFVAPNAAAVRQIAIGEKFVIELGGMQEVPFAKIVGGAAAAPLGTPLYIVKADNNVTPAAGTVGTTVKFGVVAEVITARSVIRVNTNEKGSF